MTEKDSLLQTWEREFKTTLRVLKNIPQEKTVAPKKMGDLRVLDLAWTMVMDSVIIGDSSRSICAWLVQKYRPSTVQAPMSPGCNSK